MMVEWNGGERVAEGARTMVGVGERGLSGRGVGAVRGACRARERASERKEADQRLCSSCATSTRPSLVAPTLS